MKLKQKSAKRKWIILTGTVLVVLLGAYGTYAYFNNLPPFQGDEERFSVDDEGRGVNQAKTKLEKKQIEQVEKNSERKENRPNTDTPQQPAADSSTGRQTVSVMMTSVGQSIDRTTIDASGFVVNAVEQGGSCVYRFTSSSGREVTKKSRPLQNPNSTTCETVRFPASELQPGEWQVSLLYSSEQSEGSSDVMRLVVE